MNVFTYGSLMIPTVMATVTGKRFQMLKACLKDYARFRVIGESYPGMVYTPGAATPGIVHCAIDDLSLKMLDEFEGGLYERISVLVEIDQHGPLTAEAYLISPEHLHLLSFEPWDLEEFKKKHLEEFLQDYKGFSRLREQR